MTAQGGGILVWLDTVITRREEAARATGWDSIETVDYLWGTKHLLLRRTGESLATTDMDADLAVHIALNDPESVLRRCAADRKLLAEHGPCSERDWSCKGCGFNYREEPMVNDYRDCPVLNALAEGYGWTEGER